MHERDVILLNEEKYSDIKIMMKEHVWEAKIRRLIPGRVVLDTTSDCSKGFTISRVASSDSELVHLFEASF